MLPVLFDIATACLLVDCVISGIAMNVFYARLVYNYKINIPNAEFYAKAYKEYTVHSCQLCDFFCCLGCWLIVKQIRGMYKLINLLFNCRFVCVIAVA